jgi:hypothetical protein
MMHAGLLSGERPGNSPSLISFSSSHRCVSVKHLTPSSLMLHMETVRIQSLAGVWCLVFHVPELMVEEICFLG